MAIVSGSTLPIVKSAVVNAEEHEQRRAQDHPTGIDVSREYHGDEERQEQGGALRDQVQQRPSSPTRLISFIIEKAAEASPTEWVGKWRAVTHQKNKSENGVEESSQRLRARIQKQHEIGFDDIAHALRRGISPLD